MDAARIADLLPEVFRRAVVPGEPLSVAIAVMDAMHAPVEAVLDRFESHVDPYRCPEAFVPYLAHWVGLGWLVADLTADGRFPAGDGPLRAVVARAAALAKLRGTATGMSAFLVLATGMAPFEVGTGTEPFHLVVRGPADARPLRELVERVVQHEKPAFTSASIALGDEDEHHLGRRWARLPATDQPEPSPPPAHLRPLPGAPDA